MINDDEEAETEEPGEASVANGLRSLFEEARLDFAALIWMCSTVAVAAVGIYSALTFNANAPSGFDVFGGWGRVRLLANTVTLAFVVAVAVGVAVAALADSTATRVALRLGVVASAWVIAASFLMLAYVLWAPTNPYGTAFRDAGFAAQGTGAAIMLALARTLLGAVVALAAVLVLVNRNVIDEGDDEPGENLPEPEPALS